MKVVIYMRNKEKFIADVEKVANQSVLSEVDFVEDAAHTLNNDIDNHGEYTIIGDFTTTGKNETFIFVRNERPKTDNPNESIEDWFYEGRA